MQETTEAPVQVSAEQPTQTQQEFNPFARESWSETAPQNPTSETKPTEGVAPSSAEPTATPSSQEPAKVEPTVTANEWWKTFGWENEDAAKAEIPKLKEVKPAEEIKWANEDSKKVHELLREGKIDDVVDIYNKQKQLDKVLKSEVNTQTADEIIKLQMKLKYPTLNDQQIDFQFNEDYGVGKKPVYNDTKETEDEYNERLAEYNERADRINMKKTIAATMAIPELQKLKTEIKFPEISQPQTQPQPSQESLEAARVARENFLQKLESDYTKVEGFQTKVKDESVELAIGHKIPDEVKAAIKGRLTEGMDVNEFMDKRWFDAKGNANINQIMLDIYQLENLDKILSSVANNAANQRMAEYIKVSKNLNINNGNGFQQTFQPSQQAQQNVSPFDQSAWSEKPPLIQN